MKKKEVTLLLIVLVDKSVHKLKRCLEAICGQTMKNISILCVNQDEDESVQHELERMVCKDKRITLFASSEFNIYTIEHCLQSNDYDFWGIVTTEIIPNEDAYERLSECAVMNSVDMVKSDFFIDVKSNVIYERLSDRLDLYNTKIEVTTNGWIYRSNPIIYTGIYSKKVFEALEEQIRNINICFNDRVSFFQLLTKSASAYLLPEALFVCESDGCISVGENSNEIEKIQEKGGTYPLTQEMYYVTLFCEWDKKFIIYGTNYIEKNLSKVRKIFTEAYMNGCIKQTFFAHEEWNNINQLIFRPRIYVYNVRMRHYQIENKIVRKLAYELIYECMEHGIFSAGKVVLRVIRNILVPAWSYADTLHAHLNILGRKFLKKLRFSTLSMRKMETYKNIHLGERCFIICTGPSLRIEDVEMLENEFTIGVNSIFCAYEFTDWRPTYYALVDRYIAQKYEGAYELDFTHFAKRGVFVNSYVKHKEAENIQECYIDCKNHRRKNLMKNRIYIDNDLDVHIYDCFTVTNMAINLAIYMGFSEIYLVGADCNFEGAKMHFVDNEFDPKYAQSGRLKTEVNRSLNGYKAMKEFAKQKGVNIYNATRGGKLEIFERVELDMIQLKKE